jgi:DNA ligase (NAD+)
MIKRLVDAGYDTLDKIKNASKSDLTRVEGFADLTTEKLLKGFQDFYDDMLSLLDTHKIKIKGTISRGKLKGLSFCFTGKLNSMARSEAEKLVVEHGGEYKSSVVKGLSYLITNETEQTTKFQKAQRQGTKIIDEEQFLALLK